MKVNIVSLKLDSSGGGSNVSLHVLAEALSDRGHSVTVITVDSDSNDLPEAHKYDVSEFTIDRTAPAPVWTLELKRLIASQSDCDLLHVFDPILLPAAGLYRRNGNTPVIGRLNAYTLFCTNQSRMNDECYARCTSYRKYRHDDKKRGRKLLQSPIYLGRTHAIPRIVAHVDKLFAQSPTVRDAYLAAGFTGPITVVPNCYDPSFPQAPDHDPDEVRLDAQSFNVLYVGRLEPYKGVDTLLKAAANSGIPNVSVHIIGDGESRSELEELARTMAGDCDVGFYGWIENESLAPYVRAADVFVHPAVWPEPFGRTVLEAMQCEVPVIVSDGGGPSWVAGDAGVVFPVGDVDALASVLSRMSAEPETRQRLAHRSRERVDRFAPERVLNQIEREYESVM